MIFCARATRGLRRVGGGAARPSFLLAEAARSECAPSMRAVNDSLAAPPRAKWEKRKALAWANGTSMGEEAVLADSGWVKKTRVVEDHLAPIPEEVASELGGSIGKKRVA